MSLSRRATRGAAWSIASGIISRGFALLGTLILMRWVGTADYGDLAVATSLVVSAQHFSSVGVGTYVLANPSAGRDVVFHATAIHLLTGVVALGSVILLLGPLGRVFETAHLATYVPGLVFAALVERVSAMPERVLARKLRFGVLSVGGTLGELSFTAVSVALGFAGFGALSIVLAGMFRAVLRAGILILAADWRDWIEPHPLRRETLVRLWRYGLTVSLGFWATSASRRWDNFLMLRMHGSTMLGYYDRAYTLAEVPAVQIASQIMDVLMASFPKVDAARRPQALLRVIRLLALVMFPLGLGLGVVAEPLVMALLPPHLAAVAPFLLVLSALSVVRPIGDAVCAFFQAQIRPMAVAKVEWVTLALMVSSVFLLGQIGPIWAACGAGAAFSARYLLYLGLMKRVEGLEVVPFLRALLPPLTAAGLMIAAILVFRRLFVAYDGGSALLQLGAEILVGMVVYAASALLIARDASGDLLTMARQLRRG
jgi:PST family polysaccharide transporter